MVMGQAASSPLTADNSVEEEEEEEEEALVSKPYALLLLHTSAHVALQRGEGAGFIPKQQPLKIT